MGKNPANIFNQLLKAKYGLAQEYRLLGLTETSEAGIYSLTPLLGPPQVLMRKSRVRAGAWKKPS